MLLTKVETQNDAHNLLTSVLLAPAPPEMTLSRCLHESDLQPKSEMHRVYIGQVRNSKVELQTNNIDNANSTKQLLKSSKSY